MGFEPFIRKLEAAGPLSAIEMRSAIELCSDIRHIPRRKDIIAEGAAPSHVHIVLNGWAARYTILRNGTRRITALLLPGDICDLHSGVLLSTDHGVATLSDCAVAHIPGDRMEEFACSTPTISRALWRSSLVNESIVRQWLVNAGRRSAGERLAHLLSELYLRMDDIGAVKHGQMDVPLTQDEFGDATGMTGVHVNRTFRELRQRGLVISTQGKVYVPDLKTLAKVGGFNARYLHLREAHPQNVAASNAARDASGLTRLSTDLIVERSIAIA